MHLGRNIAYATLISVFLIAKYLSFSALRITKSQVPQVSFFRSNNPTSSSSLHKDLYFSACSAVRSGHIQPGNLVHWTISASTAESPSAHWTRFRELDNYGYSLTKSYCLLDIFNRKQVWNTTNKQLCKKGHIPLLFLSQPKLDSDP